MTALSTPTDQGVSQNTDALLQAQRTFFATGQTKPYDYRLAQLKKLKSAILERQEAIVQAAKDDLGRPEFEGYFEIGVLA
ncbi:MAG: aldehyde dehydrogenase family protein, partial [Cyanobacteria bacterium J06560_2]